MTHRTANDFLNQWNPNWISHFILISHSKMDTFVVEVEKNNILFEMLDIAEMEINTKVYLMATSASANSNGQFLSYSCRL